MNVKAIKVIIWEMQLDPKSWVCCGLIANIQPGTPGTLSLRIKKTLVDALDPNLKPFPLRHRYRKRS